jgi:hypothetical protein
MIKLEKSNTARVVTFAEMKVGQIGEIVRDEVYNGEIVLKIYGEHIGSITTGRHWEKLDSNTLKVRLLEVGETLVITEN